MPAYSDDEWLQIEAHQYRVMKRRNPHQAARMEHAWLLRAEGLTYLEIAARLGISRSRAEQMIKCFGFVVSRVLRSMVRR